MMAKLNVLAGKLKQNGISQKELACRLKKSEVAISDKMTGKRPIKMDEAKLISEILYLTGEEILDIFF